MRLSFFVIPKSLDYLSAHRRDAPIYRQKPAAWTIAEIDFSIPANNWFFAEMLIERFEVVADAVATLGLAQLLQCLRFDLAHPLAGKL